ncbi:Ig-like domain-containing protein, partial [Altererythrobacter sp.]
IASVNQGTDTNVLAGSVYVLAGQYGTLNLNPDGTYTYIANADITDGATLVDVFTYTVEDEDGDRSTANLTIDVTNVTVTATDDEVLVDEDGLAGPPAGTNSGTDSEIDADGSIAPSGGTGPYTYELIGANSDGDGDYGTLVLNANGTYTYTLDTAFTTSPDANNGENQESPSTESFAYRVTDANGNTFEGSIDVTIVDDVPTATNDGVYQVAEDTPLNITDALDNDVYGADGVDQATDIAVTTQATKGTVVYNNDGTFTYTPNAGAEGADSFVYTITDGDGDTDTATVSLNIAPDSTPTPELEVAAVDDDGLTGGNPASTTGDIDADVGDSGAGLSNEAVFVGSIDVDFGNDTGTVDFSNLHNTSGMVGTEMVNYTWSGTTLTATGPRGTLFTIDLQSNGTFTVTLVDNVLHASGGDETSAPLVVLNYRAVDSDGDVDTNGTLSIVFNDDAPTAVEADSATVANTFGAIGAFDLDIAPGDGNIDNNYGADGGQAIFTDASIAALEAQSLTSGGSTLEYNFGDGGNDQTILIAYKDDGIDDSYTGAVVFEIILDPDGVNDDKYVVEISAPLDALTDVNFNDGTYDFLGGNDPWAGFVPSGQSPFVPGGGSYVDDGSLDLLLTPFGEDPSTGVSNGQGDAINGNANSAGTTGGGAGQNIGTGEGIRLDFVIDLEGDPAKSGGGGANYDGAVSQQDHSFSGHYEVNGASVSFGDGQTNSTVRLKAIDVQDGPDNGAAPDLVYDTGTLVDVSEIIISFDGDTQSYVYTGTPAGDGSGNQSFTFTVGSTGGLADRDYTVNFIDGPDGVYAEVVGIMDVNVSIATFADTTYNALEVFNAAGDDFALTGFGTSTITDDPVSFSVPIAIQDGDGDLVASGDLDITLNPVEPMVVLDLNGDTNVEFLGTDEGITFDLNGDGVAESVAWAGPNEGFLWVDFGNDGLITNSGEIVFDNGSNDAFAALAVLDTNNNGNLDPGDGIWTQLKVWQDANSNGVLDVGEAFTMSDLGITSIDITGLSGILSQANGEVVVQEFASFSVDGSDTRGILDTATAHTVMSVLVDPAAEDKTSTSNDNYLAQINSRSHATSMTATAAFGAMMVNSDEMTSFFGNASVSSSDTYTFAGISSFEMVSMDSLGNFESAASMDWASNIETPISVNSNGKFGNHDAFTFDGMTDLADFGANGIEAGGFSEFLADGPAFDAAPALMDMMDASGSMMEALMALTPEAGGEVQLADAAGLDTGTHVPELAAIMDDIMAEHAIEGLLDQIAGPIHEFVGIESEIGYLGNDALAAMIDTGAFAFDGNATADMTEEAAALATMSA